MRGKYASCLRTANCCQRGLKQLKSSGEWKRWLAYKFRDLIAILPRPGHRRDKAQTPGTVPAIPGRLATMILALRVSFVNLTSLDPRKILLRGSRVRPGIRELRYNGCWKSVNFRDSDPLYICEIRMRDLGVVYST